jgi:hypothetical protein
VLKALLREHRNSLLDPLRGRRRYDLRFKPVPTLPLGASRSKRLAVEAQGRVPG